MVKVLARIITVCVVMAAVLTLIVVAWPFSGILIGVIAYVMFHIWAWED